MIVIMIMTGRLGGWAPSRWAAGLPVAGLPILICTREEPSKSFVDDVLLVTFEVEAEALQLLSKRRRKSKLETDFQASRWVVSLDSVAFRRSLGWRPRLSQIIGLGELTRWISRLPLRNWEPSDWETRTG